MKKAFGLLFIFVVGSSVAWGGPGDLKPEDDLRSPLTKKRHLINSSADRDNLPGSMIFNEDTQSPPLLSEDSEKVSDSPRVDSFRAPSDTKEANELTVDDEIKYRLSIYSLLTLV